MLQAKSGTALSASIAVPSLTASSVKKPATAGYGGAGGSTNPTTQVTPAAAARPTAAVATAPKGNDVPEAGYESGEIPTSDEEAP